LRHSATNITGIFIIIIIIITTIIIIIIMIINLIIIATKLSERRAWFWLVPAQISPTKFEGSRRFVFVFVVTAFWFPFMLLGVADDEVLYVFQIITADK